MKNIIKELISYIDEINLKIYERDSKVNDLLIEIIETLEIIEKNNMIKDDKVKKYFNESILNLLEALENSDYVLLNDILQYEIKNILKLIND